MINTLLLITSIIFLTGGVFFSIDSKNFLQSKLSAIILLIAGSSYMWMNHLYGFDNTTNLRTWRYLDWLFTVPILIYQMYLYLDPFGRTKGSLITSITCMLAMLGLGFAGEAGIISKFLGGFLGTIGLITKHEAALFIAGGLFVLEASSVIIQVISFKLFGKRVFRMAPLHHHYEKKGWEESTIVIRFWIISVILVLIALSTLKLR